MSSPKDLSRGRAFEQRFFAWFSAGQLFGAEIDVEQFCKKVKPGHRETLYMIVRDIGGEPVIGDDGEPLRMAVRDTFNQKRGRIDVVLTISDGGETTKVLIELKSRNWTRMKPGRPMKAVARDAAQLYSYQGHFTTEMWDLEKQKWHRSDDGVASVQMFLIYEFKPEEDDLAQSMTDLCGEDAIQLIWFEDLVDG